MTPADLAAALDVDADDARGHMWSVEPSHVEGIPSLIRYEGPDDEVHQIPITTTLSRRRGPCPADAGGPMTILFLDFDGVLNDANRKATWDAMRDARSIDRHAATDLLPEYTARVRQIVADTGARVVVCSAWQSAAGMRAVIHAALAGHGIDVYGFTLDYYRPRFSEHGWRWPAIRATVRALRPERWCWLDDEADPSMPESVRVVDGVTDADVARAVAILRGEA